MVLSTSIATRRVLQNYIYKSILSMAHKLIVIEAKTRYEKRQVDLDKSCPGCGGHQIDSSGTCFNCKRRRKMLIESAKFPEFNEPFYSEATEVLGLMLNHPSRGLRVMFKPSSLSNADPIASQSYMFLLFEEDCISRQLIKSDYNHEMDVEDKLVKAMATDLFEYIKKLADTPLNNTVRSMKERYEEK